MSAVRIAKNGGKSILDKFSLHGRTVLITGGGRGLGMDFGLALSQAGANIAVVDIHDKPHEDFKFLSSNGGEARYYKCVSGLDGRWLRVHTESTLGALELTQITVH